jgi:hexosaminidase
MTLTFFMFNVHWKSSTKKATVRRLHDTSEGPLEKLHVVHLDLKGAPPRMYFLRTLFHLIATAGANALLIEYEDMFPFEGILQNASARNAYSREEVRC